MRLRTILYLLGLLTMVLSVSMLPPIAIGWWYEDGETAPFVEAFATMLGMGFALWLPTRGRTPEVHTTDGFLVVTVFWVALGLLGAIPLMLSDAPHMRLVDAFFEAVSGLTTTGASVLPTVETLPHSINFYRMQLCFVGGMGVVVLAVALFPLLGIGGMQLYRAETPGPMKEEKLTPRISETAKNLWLVYVVPGKKPINASQNSVLYYAPKAEDAALHKPPGSDVGANLLNCPHQTGARWP